MTRPGTVVLPIAGLSKRFPGTRPKWLLTAPTGELMLERALDSVGDWERRRVVVGGLKQHLEDMHGRTAIQRAFGDKVEIVQFDEPTAGPAQTVAEILRRAEVSGPIFIKDCDSWFKIPEDAFEDAICIVDLREATHVRNIPAKSFVLMNENDIATTIVEKSVCSNYISAGGYGFHDAGTFLNNYQRLVDGRFNGEPFVSHVILESMRQGTVFRGIRVEEYEDVGTLEAWRTFRERAGVYFVDIDGVVFTNAGAYTPPFWDDPDVPLKRNVDFLKMLIEDGAQLIFVTARPEKYRAKTEASLRQAGLSWHSVIFGINHARRVLINDFAASNPHPSAVAINVPRNEDKLDQLIPSQLLPS
jgi:hypothetical protein